MDYGSDMDRFSFNINNKPYEVEIKSIKGNLALVEVNGIEYEVDIADIGDMEMPLVPRPHRALTGTQKEEPAVPAAAAPPPQPRPAAAAPQAGSNSVVAPMPGQVFKILVSTGDAVKQGDPVIIIEAMKMENRISSGIAGTITAIHVKEGESVSEGALLITVGD